MPDWRASPCRVVGVPRMGRCAAGHRRPRRARTPAVEPERATESGRLGRAPLAPAQWRQERGEHDGGHGRRQPRRRPRPTPRRAGRPAGSAGAVAGSPRRLAWAAGTGGTPAASTPERPTRAGTSGARRPCRGAQAPSVPPSPCAQSRPRPGGCGDTADGHPIGRRTTRVVECSESPTNGDAGFTEWPVAAHRPPGRRSGRGDRPLPRPGPRQT